MSLFRIENLVALSLVAFFVLHVLPGTVSSFTATTANNGSTITAAPDWTAPVIAAAVLQKTEGGAVDRLHAGETFRVYASVTDSGNPASGTGAVSATVGSIATTSSATMTAGSWTVNGTTYNRRSGELTARSNLSSGSYGYSISASDLAGNGPSSASGTAQALNTAFAGSAIQITSGGSSGKPSTGDELSFVYNRAAEPDSVLSGWAGAATSVTVTLVDGNLYGFGSTNDLVGVLDGSGQLLGLGYVSTNGDFVATNKTVNFSATMERDGASIDVTLGSTSGSSNLKTDTARNTPAWSPGSAVIDEYGNASSTTAVYGVNAKLF